MKTHVKRVGLGRDILVLSPDSCPTHDDQRALGCVSHEVGSKSVSIQSNVPQESPLFLTTPEAIRHTRDALTEVLRRIRRMGVE